MRLAPDEVHVWVVSLESQRHRRAELEGVLSPDERERARGYRVPAAAERFVLGRGLLREILGRYAGVPPGQLRFAYPCTCGRDDCAPSRRKPRLEHEPDLPPLRFNLSHTGGLAMLAVTTGREVGIDVERLDGAPPVHAIAERLFSASELAELQAVPERWQAEAFYRIWTRKEACGKARGTGFTKADDKSPRLSLHELPAPDGYVATLAVEGNGCLVRSSTWPPNAAPPRKDGAEPAA